MKKAIKTPIYGVHGTFPRSRTEWVEIPVTEKVLDGILQGESFKQASKEDCEILVKMMQDRGFAPYENNDHCFPLEGDRKVDFQPGDLYLKRSF